MTLDSLSLGGTAIGGRSLAYLNFVWALPKRIRLHFIMAGVIFLTGAREADLYGYDTVIYCFLYSVEEMLEMLGVVLFIYALLSYLAQLQGGLVVVLTSSPGTTPPVEGKFQRK